MKKNGLQRDNRGISLIEVVAGILIIGLIFLGFYGLFISSNKIGVASEKIVDATYIGQQSMEELYNSIKTQNLNQLHISYSDNKTSFTTNYSSSNQNIFYYSYSHEIAPYKIKIQFTQKTNAEIPNNLNLYNVTVNVYENNILKTTMENIFSIK